MAVDNSGDSRVIVSRIGRIGGRQDVGRVLPVSVAIRPHEQWQSTERHQAGYGREGENIAGAGGEAQRGRQQAVVGIVATGGEHVGHAVDGDVEIDGAGEFAAHGGPAGHAVVAVEVNEAAFDALGIRDGFVPAAQAERFHFPRGVEQGLYLVCAGATFRDHAQDIGSRGLDAHSLQDGIPAMAGRPGFAHVFVVFVEVARAIVAPQGDVTQHAVASGEHHRQHLAGFDFQGVSVFVEFGMEDTAVRCVIDQRTIRLDGAERHGQGQGGGINGEMEDVVAACNAITGR